MRENRLIWRASGTTMHKYSANILSLRGKARQKWTRRQNRHLQRTDKKDDEKKAGFPALFTILASLIFVATRQSASKLDSALAAPN